MELEEFVELYKNMNPEPLGNVGRLKYDYKLERLNHFLFDLKQEGLLQPIQENQARLFIRAYDEGYSTGTFWENVAFEDLKQVPKPVPRSSDNLLLESSEEDWGG